MSPWSRDGNQRMFLLRDRRGSCWWGPVFVPKILILRIEDRIIHQWSLRTSREFVQRQLWGLHAGRLGFTNARSEVMTCVMPIYYNSKILIQSCSKSVKCAEKSNHALYPKTWYPHLTTIYSIFRYFQSSNSAGKYHLATCSNPRKSAWILPLGFHSKLELGLKGRVAFFFTCSCSS